MTDERKPLPVACRQCGAATDHDKVWCYYCRGLASRRGNHLWRVFATTDVRFGNAEIEGVTEVKIETGEKAP